MMPRAATALMTLSLALGGCAVVELTAHAVKEVEKSQRETANRSTTPEDGPPQAQPVREEEPPPPVSAPAPRRSTVTVEELPAR